MELKQRVDDRRTGVRLNFHVLVSAFIEKTGQTYQGVSVNVSVSGLLFTADTPTDLEDVPCSVTIHFPGSHSNLLIQDLYGTIVRASGGEVAVAFDQPLEWFLLFPVYQRKLGSTEDES